MLSKIAGKKIKTMNVLLEHINSKTVEFSQKSIFQYLENDAVPIGDRLRFAPCMAHFVFSFMDINRFLLPDIAGNSACHKLINVHAAEDAWHWPWYLEDLQTMQLDPCMPFSETVRFLWGESTRRSRLLSYQCIALIGRATVIQKIAIVETIEITGKIFLENTAKLCSLWKEAPAEMLYFGKNHADCETGHHMGTEDVTKYLESIVLDAQDTQACIEMVDVLFEFYENFADEMLEFARKASGLDVDSLFQVGALQDAMPQ